MARRGDGIYLRGRMFYLDFQHDGRRHVVRLGKNISRTVAGELARMQRAAVLKGEAGIGPARRRKDPPFETAATEFLTWVQANKKPHTLRGYRGYFKRLEASFTGRRLGDIDPLSIERHKHTRVAAGARVAANRELAVLKAMFNRCRKLGLYEGPTPEIRLTREPKTRIRFLEPDEEAKLLGAAPEPLRTMLLVGIYAGLRMLSEALTLRWADVDLRRGFLTVQAAYAKSGKTRTVPLNTILRTALKTLRQRAPETAQHVFEHRDGSPYRSIRTTFQTACKAAGLKDVTPHVLRHTFASRLAMAGVDPRTIQELGGWASLEMVERYTHLSPTHKAEAVERIAQNSPTLFTTRGEVVPLAVATT